MRLSRIAACSLSIALVAATLVLGASPARAAFPGANGKIVFASTRNTGIDQIWSMNPDGSSVRRLTNEGSNQDPAWSPDGSRIAFVSYRDPSFSEIYGMNADGSGETNLTNSPEQPELTPAWSADGTKIAFTRYDVIYVMNADGSGQTSLGVSGNVPAWSPDGTKIAFSRSDEIWVVNADGSGDQQQLTTNDAFDALPSWSPDGTKIAFVSRRDSNYEIYVMNAADGSEQTRLTNYSGGDLNPAWSPDGTRIVFQRSSIDGEAQADIYVMDADGSNPTIRAPSNNSNGNPDWQPLHLSLTVSDSKVVYKRSVTVRAHLFAYQTTSNPTVSIYKIPYNGEKILVLEGAVNANGNLSATVKPTKETTFVAEWTGDSEHRAGGESPPKIVEVYPIVTGTLSGHYGTDGRYRLYHYTSRCPNSGQGCPTYTAKVTPNHAGEYVKFTLQLYVSGSWQIVLSFRRRLNDESKRKVIFVYGNRSVIGIPTRARARFPGDEDHLARNSAWDYFRVTA